MDEGPTSCPRADAPSHLDSPLQPGEEALRLILDLGLREGDGGPAPLYPRQHSEHHLSTAFLAPNSLRQRGALQVPGGLTGAGPGCRWG